MNLKSTLLLSAALAGGAHAQIAQGATKFLGNITTGGALRSDFFGLWNQLTPENETKWSSIEGKQGVRNWKKARAYADSCKAHGATFKFHALVWGSQYPKFMDSAKYADTTKHRFVEEWIADAAAQFPDVELIDVVNEPDHTRPAWATALGDTSVKTHGWVVESFRLARKHFPKAKLILNDYNNLRWDIDKFITIANHVKAAGYLDAIGCQAHDLSASTGQYTYPTLDSATLRKNLKKLHDSLDVPIYITELDLSYQSDSAQLAAYKSLFPVMWESPYVPAVTLWGYVYGTTWSQAPYSGLIQDDGTERPAMAWLKDYVATHRSPAGGTSGVRPATTPRPAAATRLELRQEQGHLRLQAVPAGRPGTDVSGRL